eukprot:s1024_g6.t1
MHQHGANGAEQLRDVLRCWATAVSSSVQNQAESVWKTVGTSAMLAHEGCVSESCGLPPVQAEASDAFASIQVIRKPAAENQFDNNGAIYRFNLTEDGGMAILREYENGTEEVVDVDPNAPGLLQGQSQERGLPKIWKIKKIKEALERRRQHPPCPRGDFFFSFPNAAFLDPNQGLVTGCMSGIACNNERAEATSIRVLTNEAGFGLGEYVPGLLLFRQKWNVTAGCEIVPVSSTLSVGPAGLPDNGLSLGFVGSDIPCAGLSNISGFTTVAAIEAAQKSDSPTTLHWRCSAVQEVGLRACGCEAYLLACMRMRFDAASKAFPWRRWKLTLKVPSRMWSSSGGREIIFPRDTLLCTSKTGRRRVAREKRSNAPTSEIAGSKSMWIGLQIGSPQSRTTAEACDSKAAVCCTLRDCVRQSKTVWRWQLVFWCSVEAMPAVRFHLSIPGDLVDTCRRVGKGQKKMQHFRKLQAHTEITKLCVSTGDWIDQLRLREVLALWRRQALQEILTRHAAEEEGSRKLQVRLKAHYRIIEIIRGKSTERQTALALAHVCLGAWSIAAAMENAQKLTDKARQNSIGHRSHGRRMLVDAQDLAGAVLAFCLQHSLSAFQRSAWPLVKRCFPLWRREAALSSARRRILAKEAANLQITEEMRRTTERYQHRCSRWAVAQMMEHQKMRYLEEAFFLWCDQQVQWRHRPSHRKQLELADAVLMKGAEQLQVFFVAWKRVQAEEKVLRSEEEMWQLEGLVSELRPDEVIEELEEAEEPKESKEPKEAAEEVVDVLPTSPALLEGRPLKIVGMGPSTTFGRGCPGEEHRWTNSLQNLSSFTGSRLRLEVINQARPATPISTQWRSVLEPYREEPQCLDEFEYGDPEDPMIDLIVVDYTVTSTDAGDAKRSAALVYSIIQESCDAAEQEACTGALNDVCAKGFARTIEEFKLQKDEVLNLSKEESLGFLLSDPWGQQQVSCVPRNCEMHIATSLAHSGPFGFAAFVSASASKWRLGADRPGKYGWIANDVPAELVNLEKPQRGWPLLSTYPRYSKLKASEIVFLVRSTLGIVFVDYLSSYNNIGSATCQLEDLQGQALGPSVTIDALWSKQMSISQRVTLEMGTTPPGGLRGPNVAVRPDWHDLRVKGACPCELLKRDCPWKRLFKIGGVPARRAW